MDISFQKRELICLEPAVREVQNTEQTQELRLPDGMPDIGKVLAAWGQVVLRGKEWRSDSVQASGGMLMWVLYAPEDGTEPRILDGWLPFQVRWGLPEGCREGTLCIHALTRFADARSVSPRKLMLRAGIGLMAEAWVPRTVELLQPGKIPAEMELLARRYPVRLPKYAGEKEFSLEEELSPVTHPAKLLYYTLRPEITDQKVVGNKIAFRGNGNLHALWLGEDGRAAGQDFPMPFSQLAELPQTPGKDAQADVRCCVTNLELDIGESGDLHVRCSVAAQYVVDEVEVVETVEDAYIPGGSLRLERRILEVPAILDKRMETVSAETALTPEDGQIADLSFLPDYPRQFRENGGVVLEIPGTVQMLTQAENGSLRASSSRWEGKLDWTADEKTALSAIPAVPPQPQAMGNGIHAELPVQMITSGGEGIPMVTELEQQGTIQPDPLRPSLILRRAGTDSLWEIAKSCGSTMSAIRNANGFPEEPHPGQMLLIPVC